jgi:hypothetical protein
MKTTLHDLTAPVKEARSFDKWFKGLPKKTQDKLRDAGVLPYCEMVQPRHVFEINPNHRAWATQPEEQRVEVDSFISRETIGRQISNFMSMLTRTNDMKVRRYIELVRWALEMPGCLSAPEIAKMYGCTKQAVHKKANSIRLDTEPDCFGGFITDQMPLGAIKGPGKTPRGRRKSQ